MMAYRYYLASLTSALLFAAVMPGQLWEQGSLLLGLIALTAHFYALTQAPDRRVAAGCGFIFGLASSALTYYWLIFYRNFALWTISSVSLAHGVGHLILAMVFFRVRICNPVWRPFIFATLWSGLEYMKSIGYLALPWGSAGLPATQSLILTQHIELTGMWSLHFAMALANAIIAELLLLTAAPPVDRTVRIADGRRFAGAHNCRRAGLWWVSRQALCLLTMAACAILFGAYRLHNRLPVVDRIPLLIVQQNTDAWNEGVEAAITSNITLSRSGMAAIAAENLQPPEMIIWSENSVGFAYIQNKERYQQWPSSEPLLPFITETATPLLTGNPYIERNDAGHERAYNSALLIDGDGRALDYYGKRHLVPFAEHVPFWDIELMRTFYRNVVGLSGTWDIGTVEPTMNLNRANGETLTFGVLICFEDSFGYLARDIARRGGQLLVNLTNNSWSQRESAQIQHLSTGRLRAIETRRALVRSTNSGESVLINGYGEIEQRLPSFERAYLYVVAPIYNVGLTVHSRWGDYLGQMQMWSAVVMWILCFTARGRRRLV